MTPMLGNVDGIGLAQLSTGFTRYIKYPDIWANVVIVLSMLGIVAVASGTVIGLLRLRTTKRYRNGSVTI